MYEVLDACCGSKMFWFQKKNPSTLYADSRQVDTELCDGRRLIIRPDKISDFRSMPYPNGAFNLVIFDPPHLRSAGENAWMKKKYGSLDPASWKDDIKAGFSECWRVLVRGGTLIFKWNETQIKIKEVLELAPAAPLFGQTTTQNLKTHWIVFYKSQSYSEDA